MREIWIGVLSSVFFAVTFILNRSMELSGGSWLWSSSLRYFFMVPFLIAIVAYRKGLGDVKKEIVQKPAPFFIWSVTAFVLFYAPLTYAAAYSPGWLLAGTWQLTIVAGVLLAPLFTIIVKTTNGEKKIRQKIPVISLGITLIIFAGVVLIQIPHAQSVEIRTLLLGIIPVIVAAFAYPLGNRKMMELLGGRLDTFQRVLGMTLMTLPVWIGFAIYALLTVGPPSMSQLIQSFIVGVSSGVIATTLFSWRPTGCGTTKGNSLRSKRHSRRNSFLSCLVKCYSRHRSSRSSLFSDRCHCGMALHSLHSVLKECTRICIQTALLRSKEN